MKIIFLSLIILVTGCSTVKPWPEFPPLEESLMKPCPELIQLPVDVTITISQLTESVVNNYTLRHLCANKVEGWKQWYETQKKIYDEAKKKSQ